MKNDRNVNAHLTALLALLVFSGWCAGLCAFNGGYWWGWFFLYPAGVWVYAYVYQRKLNHSW